MHLPWELHTYTKYIKYIYYVLYTVCIRKSVWWMTRVAILYPWEMKDVSWEPTMYYYSPPSTTLLLLLLSPLRILPLTYHITTTSIIFCLIIWFVSLLIKRIIWQIISMFRRTQFTAATDDDANKHFTMKIVTWPDEQGTTTAFIPNKLAPISSIHSFIHPSINYCWILPSVLALFVYTFVY